MAADENQVKEKAELDASHADPANWRGAFYFNKHDPRIFPPKKISAVGRTINFANPWSVAILITMVLLSVGLPLLLFWIFDGH